MLLFCSLLFFQQFKNKGLFIKERTDITFETGERESFFNEYWMSKNRIRHDPDGENLTLIYDLDLHLFYLIDHTLNAYRISKVELDRRNARLNLLGLANFREGLLKMRDPLIIPTGKRKKVESWVCEEYKLNFPDQSGIECSIWATYHPLVYKNFHKKLWQAALGTSPPSDVKQILNEVLRSIKGVPIQITTVIKMEEHSFTTSTTLTDIIEYEETVDFMAIPEGYQLIRD